MKNFKKSKFLLLSLIVLLYAENVLAQIQIKKGVLPTVEIKGRSTAFSNEGSIQLTAVIKNFDRIRSFVWERLNGPSSGVASHEKYNINNLRPGVSVYRVIVTDEKNRVVISNPFSLTVNVSTPAPTQTPNVVISRPVAPLNRRPVASTEFNAYEIQLPTNSILINSTSSDEEDEKEEYPLKHEWILVAKPDNSTEKIIETGSNSIELINLKEGIYRLELVVFDSKGASDKSEILINVLKEPLPPPPVIVIKGDEKRFESPEAIVVLKVENTNNSPGLAYEWKQLSGKALNLRQSNTNELILTGLTEDVYQFKVTATDKHGQSTMGAHTLVIRKNKPPVLKLKEYEKTIQLPESSYIFSTSEATDLDGSIKSFKWEKIKGGKCILGGANTSSLLITNLSAGYYEFQLTATDDQGLSVSVITKLTVKFKPPPR